jgi:large subunit ribosomal protein L10
MSKQIKQMEMDALKASFGDVRDLVFLSIQGIDAKTTNQMRLALRKKSIRLHTVKNSLAAIVFREMGIKGIDEFIAGSTTVAWGSTSIADLAKELGTLARKNDKVKPKGAVADGVAVPFDAAKKFPTRAEAIGRVVAMALGPARKIAGQLRAAGGTLASQIKTLSEKKPEEAAAPAAAEAAPAAT